MITLGGNAELELVDSMDPFSEGIIFSVMPPKKSWKNISNLSGGEKTLSSLALVFALHVFKVCCSSQVLTLADSISSLRLYISWTKLMPRSTSVMCLSLPIISKTGRRTRSSSLSLCGEFAGLLLWVIIHELRRNDMFELSQRLIGIYKTNNATQSKCFHLDILSDLFADLSFTGISIDNKALVHSRTQ